MKTRLVLTVIFLCFLWGCSKSTSEDRSSKTPVVSSDTKQKFSLNTVVINPAAPETGSSSGFAPFRIYMDKGSRENHYIPSGFMPDGKCLSLDDTWHEDCHSGNTCLKIVYAVECSRQGAKWAGIYWLNPANNWGKQNGGFNLTGAQKLSFWARGQNGGERIEELKVGGIMGEYPDSDTAVIGPVLLTKEWKQYTVDLRGKDLSYLSGGFAWSTNIDVNPEECIFYLDDIQYE